MSEHRDIFAEVREANRIEDVMREAGVGLKGHGKYLAWDQHDSFVVDAGWQSYKSFNPANLPFAGMPESGDLITFVQAWKRTDAKGAVEFLARRAGIDFEWGQGNPEAKKKRLAARVREDALTVAARVFWKRLWKDERALAYVRGRGWTDETIKAAGLGYTGNGTAEELAELLAALEEAGIDPASPAAAAVLGFEGDLTAWAKKHGLDLPTDWLGRNKVYPLPKGGLVYPHIESGRVVYVSLRQVPGGPWPFESKSFNLVAALAGSRRPLYNTAYQPSGKRAVVVEGQADAITLAQWGIPAVALAGTSAGQDTHLLKTLRERHGELYVALDKDEAGERATHPLGEALGPTVRLVTWPKGVDANDWMQAMAAEGVGADKQAEMAGSALDASLHYVEYAARKVGATRGAAYDEGVKKVVGLVNRIDDQVLASQLRPRIAKALSVSIRDYQNMLKAAAKSEKDDRRGEDPENITAIVGGFIEGWLIELTYDKDTNTTAFAYRDPDGIIGEAGRLDINGRRYVPILPTTIMTFEAVLFPSRLGPEVSTAELAEEIYRFITRYYDIEPFFGRLASFYVLFTWVYDCFRSLPYLRALGDWGSGKTEFAKRVGHLCYRLMKMSGAASSSAIFRTVHRYGGTLFLDEADLNQSDAANDIIKILNTGNQKGTPVWRVSETGNKEDPFKEEAYNVYGPKIIAMREPFKDQATESRCLTLQVRKRTTMELIKKGIPIELEEGFYVEALAMRNKLLRWRLKTWQENIPLSNDDIDPRIEPRLNQVTMALKRLVEDDKMREDIETFIRAYNDKLVLDRQMTLEAKVLEAIIKIQETGGVPNANGDIEIDLSMQNITVVTNLIVDEENRLGDEDEEDDEDEKSWRKKNDKKLTAKSVGNMVSKKLGLERERLTSGPQKGRFAVVWDDERIQALRETYGL